MQSSRFPFSHRLQQLSHESNSLRVSKFNRNNSHFNATNCLVLFFVASFLSDNFKKSFMKAFTCAKTKEINAQLQVENSFFPRFGRSRNSECFSKPTTHLVSNTNMTSKLTQSTKFGNTVESILDATYINGNGHENGHNPTNGHHNNTDGALLNSVNNLNGVHGEDESCVEEEDEREMEDKQNDNSICIINSGATGRAPVLHTDL